MMRSKGTLWNRWPFAEATEEELRTTAKAHVVGLCFGRSIGEALGDWVADGQGHALGRRETSSIGCNMKCIDNGRGAFHLPQTKRRGLIEKEQRRRE